MANLKASKKSTKTSEKRRIKNLARRSALKTVIRKVEDALKVEDSLDLTEIARKAESMLARAKGKKVLKARTASRKISKLAKKVAGKAKGS